MIARKKLGEILVEGGLLTQKQLDQALPFQKKSTLKLGQFLVREGIVSETQIVELLSNQLKLEKYRPDKHILDMELSHLVPAEIAVVLVEWRLLLWALGGSPRRMLVVSAAMNAASALAGLVFWLS